MAKMEIITTSALHGVMTRVISAHEAIREGIATHAQKHEHKLDERRNERNRQLRIAEGVKRQNAKLCPDRKWDPAIQVRILDSDDFCCPCRDNERDAC